ncbi:hypothetical protein FGB62_55g043 [Gracilaria domingensis]|nr:hypothetical protein FGB62_55g043 [Gracilaria domingensis]
MLPPPGFVIGKDGKLRKKRGRKPTPGLSDEQRRQARLLKNRRTAETSRRRKIALMKRLAIERDDAQRTALKMGTLIHILHERLAAEMKVSVNKMLEREPWFKAPEWPKPLAEQDQRASCSAAGAQGRVSPEQSDVSRAPSVAESEEEGSACNAATTTASSTSTRTIGESKKCAAAERTMES